LSPNNQYRRVLRRTDPDRYTRTVHIDYLKLPREDIKDEREVCRFLTFKVNDTKWGHHQVPERLESFLRSEGNRRGGTLELILDEVDLVCNTHTFQLLAEAAKEGACRVILCGKSELYDAMNRADHVFYKRLRLLPLGPLGASDARLLFVQPLIDLGFRINRVDEEQIFREVFSDTGGYPHLLQFYGDAIITEAMRRGSEDITPALCQAVANSDETDQIVGGQLLSIEDPLEQLIGLSLIQRYSDQIGESTIREIAAHEGISLGEREAERFCRKFYINNILTRCGDYYQVANRGLAKAVRRRGYLGRRLAELRIKFSRRK
jgi:hypothetical protein